MKTIKFLSYAIFVLFLGVAISSCSGDDGDDGMDGTNGTDGAVGATGADGADGADGNDGANGNDGQDGQDGNANVQTYIYDNPAWGTGAGLDINMSGILTTEVVENDVILSYVKNSGYSEVFAIPGWVWGGSYRQYAAFVNSIPTFRIVSLEPDGSFTPNASLWPVDWVKIIIIESTNTTTSTGNGKSASSKEEIFTELQNAGIDVNDYHDVCNYYGINPK